MVHGGLFWTDGVTIDDLQDLDRFHEIPPTDTLMEDMLWSDPDPKPGRQVSPRGCALLFGADVTHGFLEENGLDLMVRSHECMDLGYEKMHNGQVITVFSASNYCGVVSVTTCACVFRVCVCVVLLSRQMNE